MGKLIFLDIDGTIAAPGQPPRPSTVEAVHAARCQGHKVFLCTDWQCGTIYIRVSRSNYHILGGFNNNDKTGNCKNYRPHFT